MPDIPIGLMSAVRIGAAFGLLWFGEPLLAAKVSLDASHWGNTAKSSAS